MNNNDIDKLLDYFFTKNNIYYIGENQIFLIFIIILNIFIILYCFKKTRIKIKKNKEEHEKRARDILDDNEPLIATKEEEIKFTITKKLSEIFNFSFYGSGFNSKQEYLNHQFELEQESKSQMTESKLKIHRIKKKYQP